MLGDGVLTTVELCSLITALSAMAPAVDDADRVERIRQFENLKSAAAAAQLAETAAFVASQKATQAVAGEPSARQGRGVAEQVGLARRVSPWQAKRYTGWAGVLTTELPRTFAALQAGQITEWRAMLVARETIWLSREDRADIDEELAPRLAGWGDSRVEAEVRRAAYRLDPAGSLARSRGAAKDRRVTVHPAPETMCRLTAFLPVAQGVAAYAALGRAADLTTAAGDHRGRGQIMADTLVERVTGQATADAVPVEIELIMTSGTLFGTQDDDSGRPTEADVEPRVAGIHEPADAEEPGYLVGFGPVPAGLARELALGTDATDVARRRIRRLFLHPDTGQLATMESRGRLFTANERRFIRYRDQGMCRTPWCGAPIRHTDHVQPAAHGGRTAVQNGQGLCEACNYARQAAGWRSRVLRDGTVITVTPTGHTYRSRAPEPPGSPPVDRSPVERRLRVLLEVA